MTHQHFNSIAKEKLSKLSVSDLKKQAIELNSKFDDASTLVFDCIIDVLMSKMCEVDFVEFCDSL